MQKNEAKKETVNVAIDRDVHQRVKILSAKTGRTIIEIVEKFLDAGLKRKGE